MEVLTYGKQRFVSRVLGFLLRQEGTDGRGGLPLAFFASVSEKENVVTVTEILESS